MNELISFRHAEIPKIEVETLQDLEQLLDVKPILIVNKLHWDTYGAIYFGNAIKETIIEK